MGFFLLCSQYWNISSASTRTLETTCSFALYDLCSTASSASERTLQRKRCFLLHDRCATVSSASERSVYRTRFFVLYRRCSTLSSASARTSGNQDVTHSHQWYYMQGDYTLSILLYARCSTVSSTSDRTQSLVIFSTPNSLFGLTAYLIRNHRLICDWPTNSLTHSLIHSPT